MPDVMVCLSRTFSCEFACYVYNTSKDCNQILFKVNLGHKMYWNSQVHHTCKQYKWWLQRPQLSKAKGNYLGQIQNDKYDNHSRKIC